MEWKWSKANEKSLAQFVTEQAAGLLKLPENHFDLVHNREGRRRLVELIYQALVNKEINYTWAKYHPDPSIQRIRQPNEVLSFPGAGTCLDLAVLFCGICLGYNLLPLLIIIEGHALAAVSLNYRRDEWDAFGRERTLFTTQELFVGENNLKKLQKLVDDGAYIAIECTGFARTQSFSGSAPEAVGRTEGGFLTFERAVEAGCEQLYNRDRDFRFAIDIAVAHYFWTVEPFFIALPHESIAPLSNKEKRERTRLLNKVKNSWIQNVLKKSLHLQSIITLGLEERITAVASPASGAEEFADDSGQSLPSGADVADLFYDMGEGRTLLILGEAGAGKTIAILKLAEKLIARAEEDLSQLIPVVINLSSWGAERSSIDKWLVQELKSNYHVPKDISQKWIADKQLLLLLDGLDEVKTKYREECVLALNEFIQNYGGTEMVVCCRLRDYPLSERLQLQKAIYIQPLTTEQVQQYLNKAGKPLAAVKILLDQDTTLLELAQSPLTLSIISQAYEGVSVEDLPRTGSTEERRQHLFNAYIKRMLSRRGTSQRYSKQQTMGWLIWLAKRMTQESQTIFLIERIQPSWLQNRLKKFIYSIGVGLIYGLAFGLALGLAAGLSYGLITGLAIALIFGLAFGLSAWLTNVGGVEWLAELVVNVIVKVLDQLIGRESARQNETEMVTTKIPNQEIKETVRNALFWGVFGAFFSGIVSKILQPEFFLIGVLFGFAYGATTQGRVGIQHLSLRVVLYFSRQIPWDYADFLDYATERIFLQKVGGGYIFIHRVLQEHFAQIELES
jgi:hypothetical protein